MIQLEIINKNVILPFPNAAQEMEWRIYHKVERALHRRRLLWRQPIRKWLRMQ